MGRLGVAALAACLALIVGGCNDEAEPGVADPTSEPTSVETSQVTSPPTSPPSTAVTEEPAVLGPEETVRAWVEAFNEASNTGQTERMTGLSTSKCLQCKQLADGFMKIYERGGSIRSEGWVISKLRPRPDFAKSGKIASSIDSASSTIRPSSGAESVEDSATRIIMEWRLKRTSGQWLIAELTFLS